MLCVMPYNKIMSATWENET